MICKRIFWETFELIQKWFAVRRPQTIAKLKILKEKSYKFSQNLQVGEGLANFRGCGSGRLSILLFSFKKNCPNKRIGFKII